MKVIKLYSNGKLFDTQVSLYTDIIQIYILVKNKTPFKVVDNYTKRDLTSYYINKVRFDFEDVLPDVKSLQA